MTTFNASVLARCRKWCRLFVGVFATAIVLSWVVSLILALTVDPRVGMLSASRVWTPPGAIVQTSVWHGSSSVFVEQIEELGTKRSWGTEQLLGAPDTHGEGDLSTAWASATPDGGDEWIILRWNAPVRATSISVYQTYNAGAIASVSVGGATPDVEIWSAGNFEATAASEGRAPGPVVFTTSIALTRPVQSVRILIDSDRFVGWNEIDAVGLRDENGVMVYPDRAEASSCYADRSTGVAISGSLPLPSWSGMQETRVNADQPSASSSATIRLAGAFGWPFPAWAAYQRAPMAPGAPAPASSTGAMQTTSFITPVSPAYASATSGTLPMRAIPYRPLLTGVLGNSLAYTAAMLILYALLVKPLRPLRRALRMQRGCCPSCGYDLHFNFAGGCSECGLLRRPDAS